MHGGVSGSVVVRVDYLVNNLVEAHYYSIGRTEQLLSNHVAVETD